MRLVELKIKIKSLAYESKIIREQERNQKKLIDFCKKIGTDKHLEYAKAHHRTMMSLKHHRRGFDGRNGLRVSSRYAGLAYGFLRDKSYLSIENSTRPDNDPGVAALTKEIFRFNGDKRISSDAVGKWLLGKPLKVAKAA